MKKILYIILIALLSVVAGLAKATPLSGSGTETAPYIIATTADWTEFCDNHATYKNSYIKMANFVTAATNKYFNDTFSGTFDGDGYTLTVNISGGRVAPFMQVSNGTIKNLRVAGSITGSGNHTSGLVSMCTNGTTCTIQNCIVSATITNTANLGGFIGHGTAATTINMTDCVFNGTLNYSGASNGTDKNNNTFSKKVGGFVSWEGNGTTIFNLSRCLFDGTINCTAGFTPFIVKYSGCDVTGCDAASCLYTVAQSSDFPSSYTVFDGTSAIGQTAEQIVTTMNNAGGNGWRVFKGKAEPTTRPLRTLGNIPDGWIVTANGDTITVTNGTATIPAGATVVLTPTYPDRVKSVKLVDDSPLSGKFSVSATKQVQFSRGNLQATCSSADGNSSTQETWTWQFAEHQWDYIGNAAANNSINGNGSVSTAGTVDLFGWVGASSTWEGAAQYGITNSTEHEGGTDGYGNNETESLKSDWGNTIGTGWRTLTRDEWKYLFDNHTKGWSTVNGVNGYVIRPDGVSTAIAASYTASDWAAEEAAGSVFLPATGYRQGTEVNNVGSHGNYWSSSPNTADVKYAYRLYFSDSNLDPQSSYFRFFGYPVRLVKDAPAPTTSCTGKTINLQYVSSDTVAKDCDTLTGTLAANVKISIADGATVILDGVSINASGTWTTGNYAGITCAGDATITLEGTNTVKGFYQNYPGIQAAAGKTLTINGTGSLTASSNGYSAGIGGGSGVACGNIEIQGGTITATGGERGAGIGGAYNASWGNITISGGTVIATGGEQGAGIGGGRRFTADVSCGNIYISGGTVTATGGQNAAGIGGGRGNNNNYKSSCGTITITTGVTKVTATKGSDDANSIGAGYFGTCGTVTIGGTQGAITASPYTYQP